MISRFEVWLDNTALSGLHESIYIKDIQYQPASIQDSAQAYGGRDGQYVTRRYVGSAGVTVTLEIHEYSTAERHAVCEKIAAWAMNGGYLKTSDRPYRRLNVICETPPAIESALKWTDDITIGFIAYELPYWEDTSPQKLTLQGTSNSGTLKGAGYAARPFVTATVKVTGSSNLTTLTLTAGNTSITLSGLNLAQNSIIRLYYDKGILYIKRGSTSLMAKRTPQSSDDLRLEFGNNTVSISANTAVKADFEARGLYL